MDRIVIVGGGTSGWMAALAITTHLPDKKVTVIDPNRIPPIGVGESVTGVVQSFVNHPPYKLSLAEFFRESDATLKLGIWYKGWQGGSDEYLTPIDSPSRFFEHQYPAAVEEFYAMISGNGHQIGEAQTHGWLMRRNRTDYFRSPDGSIASQLSMASCHFDALKFAAWIKRKCIERNCLTHVDDVAIRFEQDSETGRVLKIITEKGEEITGDFFLDCTGFHRRVFEKAFSPKWIDLSNHIKVDRAIPSPVPHENPAEIPVYTTATAMPHGWMWQVPTQARLGKGYVYSSRYIDDEAAIQEMRAAGLDPGDSPRIIQFSPGKLSTQWEQNVCSIGLSGGFIEPLEATTIHMIYIQIRMLVEVFLPFYSASAGPALAQKYNALMRTMYDDYVDFVSFHYHTGRNDTEFWRDYQKPESITSENQMRMNKWSFSYPQREDFAGVYTGRMLFTSNINVWMPMLAGLGFANQDYAKTLVQHSGHREQRNENVKRYMAAQQQICDNSLDHAEAIRYIQGTK